MGMALFYGNLAESHADTTERWRRLWQTDEQLRQEDKKMQIQMEQFDATQKLEREKMAQEGKQFNLSLEMDEARLLLEQDRFDADRADVMYEDFVTEFSTADFLEQSKMIQSLQNDPDLGKNEYLAPRINALANTMHNRRFSETEAWTIIDQTLAPRALDEHGNVVMYSESQIESAFRTLKETTGGDTPEYLEARAEWDENKEDILAQGYEVSNANLRSQIEAREYQAAKTAQAAAEAEATEVETDIRREARQDIIDSFALANRIAAAQATQEEISADNLQDMIDTELEHLLVTIDGLHQDQDIREEQRGVTLDLLQGELEALGVDTDISRNELEVLLRTTEYRVDAERLTVERIQADIDGVKAATHLTETQREEILLGQFSSLVAAGRDEIVEGMAEEFLRPIFGDDWEDVRDRATEAAEKVRTDTEKTIEANNALTYAKAEYESAKPDIAWAQVEVSWAQVEVDRMRAKADLVRAQAANRPAPEQPFHEYLNDRGFTKDHFDGLQGQIEDLNRAANNVEGMLNMRGGAREQSLRMMEGYLNEQGITVPDFGSVSDEALMALADSLRGRADGYVDRLASDLALVGDVGARYGLDRFGSAREMGVRVDEDSFGRQALERSLTTHTPEALFAESFSSTVDTAVAMYLTDIAGELEFTPEMERNLYSHVSTMLGITFPDESGEELLQQAGISPMELRRRAETVNEAHTTSGKKVLESADALGWDVDLTDRESAMESAMDASKLLTALDSLDMAGIESYTRAYNNAIERGNEEEAEGYLEYLSSAVGMEPIQFLGNAIYQRDPRTGEVYNSLDASLVKSNVVDPLRRETEELHSTLSRYLSTFPDGN